MQIVPVGGRIKAASVGLDHLRANGVEVDDKITLMRRDPSVELRTAFFPRVGTDLRQAIRGVGFFRPILKTDQGMGGNFLPFTIDPNLTVSDLSVRAIGHEEGYAMPEKWHPEAAGLASDMHEVFRTLDLKSSHSILLDLESRRAGKGRLPFFLIRPALPERPIVFGQDVLDQVHSEVNRLLERCTQRAHEREKLATGSARPTNVIYVQPDVFVLADGTVTVEKINCPDVGLFLAGVESPESRVFPHIRSTMTKMRGAVVEKILTKMGRDITIVTRDEVIFEDQDVLEIREILELEAALRAGGAHVRVVPVSKVNFLPRRSNLLLLNLDYRLENIHDLLRRHTDKEITCFPNPYFQAACQDMTGLSESEMALGHKHRQRFLALARSEPDSSKGRADVLRHIDKALRIGGIESDIIHVVLNVETVPVFRNSMHSWRQFAARAERTENKGGMIRFRAIPATPENLMLTSSTGPRLHAFRFMCVA
jgi:hypothetical protein